MKISIGNVILPLTEILVAQIWDSRERIWVVSVLTIQSDR